MDFPRGPGIQSTLFYFLKQLDLKGKKNIRPIYHSFNICLLIFTQGNKVMFGQYFLYSFLEGIKTCLVGGIKKRYKINQSLE